MHIGLIGNQIQYSLSPQVHEEWRRKGMGLCCPFSYRIFDIGEHEIEPFLRECWNQRYCSISNPTGYLGFNVTKPYKLFITKFLEETSSAFVNTIYLGKKFWSGCSTDGAGFWQDMKDQEINFNAFQKMVLIGTGGAMQSIISYAVTKKMEDFLRQKFILLNRSGRIKIEHLTPEFSALQGAIEKMQSNSPLDLSGSEFAVINGSTASDEDIARWVYINSKSIKLWIDLRYAGMDLTAKACSEANIKLIDGLGMLQQQALLSQKKWMSFL